MSHRRRSSHPPGSSAGGLEIGPPSPLEIVIKSDTAGTLEAITSALARVDTGGAALKVIERGIGDVAKSDLLMATTGSRLVLGFQVSTRPKVEELAREHGVEVRLYDVIYRLVRDVETIAVQRRPRAPEEEVVGRAKVIALFKSTRRGVILGCEVLEGRLVRGKHFRIISAPGTVYEGAIDSLHIDQSAVETAKSGQKVGLKVEDFKQGQVGDWIECYDPPSARAGQTWAPAPGVHRTRE